MKKISWYVELFLTLGKFTIYKKGSRAKKKFHEGSTVPWSVLHEP